MKVLIVGGGAREHALAWKFARDNPSAELICAPGNAGIAEIARCVPTSASDLPALLSLARAEHVDVTVVGPEAPLAAGIVDLFRGAGLAIFGPTRAAATIESSKSFAKSIMQTAAVPTAHAELHRKADSAKRAVRKFGAPVVIKASGLAAGKGVMVCETVEEADHAINLMLRDHAFGTAGAEVLVEEFMQGEELSIFALTDGTNVLPMIPAQDHKRLLNGDRGPNTGGMGAYAPVSLVGPEFVGDVVDRIFTPTLTALRGCGCPFAGLLYAGLMLTASGVRVVEFNSRFGDPETEAILPLLESNLLDPVLAIARGESIAGSTLEWSDRHAVTTVVAADGYPEHPKKGATITLPTANDVLLFHAGTTRSSDGALTVSGGRVFAITAVADTLADAQRESVSFAERIQFEGKHYRTDIGWRELLRGARAARD
ncbi:MAG TPA: phosphoribosylamine--glycine ligase [Gemmatimonadaceae bacterium]